VGLRDVGFYLRGRVSTGLSRAINARRPGPPLAPRPLDDVLAAAREPAGRTPQALVALLEGRSDPEREAAVGRYLAARGAEATVSRFRTFEGRGENFAVDVGRGDRVLVLIAHHDAVPGSPGANDNAAAVGILLHALEGLERLVPPGLRVRLLFTAAEEIGYLGARAYVREVGVAGVAGVLSLELCGVGDSVALWDAGDDTPFLRGAAGALEGLGLRRDEDYHVVGRIPVFGSDHRAFAAAGVPSYGLTVVPRAEAEGLRRFVFSPVRSALLHAVRRPPPFDTYHTARDRADTIQPAALDLVVRAVEAIVAGSR
jgi:hypothetical protein